MDAAEFKSRRERMKGRAAAEKERIKKEGGFQQYVPDGNYLAVISGAELTQDKKENDVAILTARICEGPYRGTDLRIRQQLTDQGMQFFSSMCGKLGIPFPTLEWEEIERQFLALQDKKMVLSVAVKKKAGKDGREYPNYYINNVLPPELAQEYLKAPEPATPASGEIF